MYQQNRRCCHIKQPFPAWKRNRPIATNLRPTPDVQTSVTSSLMSYKPAIHKTAKSLVAVTEVSVFA